MPLYPIIRRIRRPLHLVDDVPAGPLRATTAAGAMAPLAAFDCGEAEGRGSFINSPPAGATPAPATKAEGTGLEGRGATAETPTPGPGLGERGATAPGAEGGDQTLPAEPRDLVEETIALVRREGRASLTMFRKKLHIGQKSAVKVMAELEKRGLVGPGNGKDPRKINLS
jgi:DNA segregation ATPase FtsK/SpoIIIE-like protein